MPTVADRMARDVVTVTEHQTLGEVARTLRRHDIGAALVVDESGAPVGIITERALVESAAASRHPDQGTAELWMTRDLVTIESSASPQEARELMTHHAIRHLPVTEDGVVVGMVSVRDVLQ